MEKTFEIQQCVVLMKTIYEFMCPDCKTLIQIEKVLADDSTFFTEVFECECGTKIQIVPTQ